MGLCGYRLRGTPVRDKWSSIAGHCIQGIGEVMAIITTETRLDMRSSPDIIRYAREYRADFARIGRYVWRRIIQRKGRVDRSKLNTEIQHKFGVKKRTANSVIYDMTGRYKALKELKRSELMQMEAKTGALQEKVSRLEKTVSALSQKAAGNELTESELRSYRAKKRSLFYNKQKLQKIKDRYSQLKKDIDEDRYKLGFGGRRNFGRQFRLEENGYRSHEGWYNDYAGRRDANIFYLGSKDESYGNQMFHLEPDKDGSYIIKIRKDGRYDREHKYVYGSCRFCYMDDEIRDIVTKGGRAVSYRLKIRGPKVYLQAVFTLDTGKIPSLTRTSNGCIGLDFNEGHIELSETDAKGNLVCMKTYPLRFHGTGGKAKNELRTVVADIGRYAISVGKDIVKENLSFVKKKSRTIKAKSGRSRDHNRMIHTLDYSRYEAAVKNMTARYGIGLIEVNPAYTSKIAKQKYCDRKKIPVHNGAAYVIARRGQGYTDEYQVNRYHT